MTMRRASLTAMLAALVVLAGARDTLAAGFISPFIGYNFGGSSGCPEITNCQDKRINYGASFGAVGSVVGFEAEIAYTDNFFGESSNQKSNVLTFMGNFMLAPKFGPIQPYGVAGIGLIRTSVEGSSTSNDENQVGFDLGGGLMVFFGSHVGVRGDVRYYHSFQILDVVKLPSGPIADEIGGRKLDFGRFAGGIVFKF